MKLEFNKIYNALIAIQVLYKHFNPIPYGISIPAVLRGRVKNTPPAQNIFRSVIFQFFYTYNESYVQLAKINKKSIFLVKRPRNRIFEQFLEI